MARRWVLVGAVALVVVLATGGALLAFSGAHRSDAAAGPVASARPSPTPTPALAPSATPAPRPTGTHRRHAAVSHAPVHRVRSAGAAGHGGGVPQADPCAHNHHCHVPPAPDPKPHFTLPPVGRPSITITGAPVIPPGADR
jgi:hypothetical protein